MTYATLKSEPDKPVETRLWQAVVLSTIQEWISGPLRYKREAEKYLFQDPKDFPLVCQQAGLDVDRLRAQLTRLRAQVAPLGHADPLGIPVARTHGQTVSRPLRLRRFTEFVWSTLAVVPALRSLRLWECRPIPGPVRNESVRRPHL